MTPFFLHLLGLRARQLLACCLLLFCAPAIWAQEADADAAEDQPFDPNVTEEAPAPETEPLEEPEPVGFGNIIGKVFDPEKKKFVRGAQVILEWPGAEAADLADDYPRQKTAVTDKEGEFRFTQVPAGFYTLRVIEDGYKQAIERDFEVQANVGNDVTIGLVSESAAEQESQVFQLDEFAAGGEVVDDSRVMLDDLARESAGSINFLSSEDFSKYAATDLADVVARLPGVNVVEGKFAVVRGLGDRYNSTLVNGMPVPSPDPLRQGLQLDLFPTSIIENVVTNKQFLPYMPSNSSGAAFELNTKAFPEEFSTWFTIGARFNSNAQDTFLRDPNSGVGDYFAHGKGSRPPSIGTDTGAAFNLTTLRPTFAGSDTGPPVGTKLGVGFGNTWDIFNRNIGVIASASYDSSYKTQIGTQQDRFGTPNLNTPPGFGVTLPPGLFVPGSLFLGELWGSGARYDVTSSVGTVLIGALAGFSAELDPEGTNKVSFNVLYSQNAEDFVQRRSNGFLPEGFAQGDRTNSFGQSIRNTDRAPGDPGGYQLVGRGTGDNQLIYRDTISYEERNLQAYQLNGEHLIEEFDDLEVNWAASYAKTSSDTPGQSVFNYSLQTNTADGRTPGFWVPAQQDFGQTGLEQLWRSIDDTVYSARADLDYTWEFLNGLEGNARAGFYYESAERFTDQVSILYNISTTDFGAGNPTFATPNDLQDAIYLQSLMAGNSGVSPGSPLPSFAENQRNIRAVYGQMTIPITEDIKVTGGARFEDLYMFAQGDTVLGVLSLEQILSTQLDGGTITNGDILRWPAALANDPGEINSMTALPGVTVTYDILEDLTFRGGWSRTLARPSFREMAPYFSLDLETGDLILGNPQLQLSPVDSWDARLEWRFGDGDLLAASVFYKDVYNPIERVVLEAGGETFLSFVNNQDRAIVKGFELEGRFSLSHFAEELNYFSIGANWSMINATVAYPNDIYQSYFQFTGINQIPLGPFVGTDGPPLGNAVAPQERRLFDQPEWIVNADITFDQPEIGTTVTLSVFAQSDVLTSVGSGINSSVDQFTGSFYQLDLTLQQAITENLKLKFAVSNITDTPRTVFYSEAFVNSTVERISYKVGRSYRFSLDYSF